MTRNTRIASGGNAALGGFQLNGLMERLKTDVREIDTTGILSSIRVIRVIRGWNLNLALSGQVEFKEFETPSRGELIEIFSVNFALR